MVCFSHNTYSKIRTVQEAIRIPGAYHVWGVTIPKKINASICCMNTLRGISSTIKGAYDA
jgi:hypothetical protein